MLVLSYCRELCTVTGHKNHALVAKIRLESWWFFHCLSIYIYINIYYIHIHMHIYTCILVCVGTSKPSGSVCFAFATCLICFFFLRYQRDVTLFMCQKWELRPRFSPHSGQVVTQEPGKSSLSPSHPVEIPAEVTLLCSLFLKTENSGLKARRLLENCLWVSEYPGDERGFSLYTE